MAPYSDCVFIMHFGNSSSVFLITWVYALCSIKFVFTSDRRPTLFSKCIASHMWNTITRTNVEHQILNALTWNEKYHCMFSLFSINKFANCVLIDITNVMDFWLANIFTIFNLLFVFQSNGTWQTKHHLKIVCVFMQTYWDTS